MKVYVAARYGRAEEVRELYARLAEDIGLQPSFDWTTHLPLKPYGENADLASRYAREDVNGVGKCDVFVLLSDEGGTGMYVEFGIALMRALYGAWPLIVVVGEHNDRSMFFFHPHVRRVRDHSELFAFLRCMVPDALP